jgi:hypothetical protein
MDLKYRGSLRESEEQNLTALVEYTSENCCENSNEYLKIFINEREILHQLKDYKLFNKESLHESIG